MSNIQPKNEQRQRDNELEYHQHLCCCHHLQYLHLFQHLHRCHHLHNLCQLYSLSAKPATQWMSLPTSTARSYTSWNHNYYTGSYTPILKVSKQWDEKTMHIISDRPARSTRSTWCRPCWTPSLAMLQYPMTTYKYV